MRAAIVCLSLLVGLQPAGAQDVVAWERFFPGEVEDYWRFEVRSEWCIGYEEWDCEETTSFRTYTVTERAQTNDAVTIVLQSDASRCRISIAEGEGWFDVEQLEGERCLPLDFPAGNLDFPQDEPETPSTVEVNGYTHTVDALKWFGEYPFGGHRFAADLGMYEYFSEFYVENQRFRDRYVLVKAEVDGTVFGQPVAADPGAPPLSLELELYPNPVQDHLVVRLETGSSQPVSVEVFDLLGRRVLVEEAVAQGGLVLDVAALAPGPYAVVTRTADGTPLVRHVTKLR